MLRKSVAEYLAMADRLDLILVACETERLRDDIGMIGRMGALIESESKPNDNNQRPWPPAGIDWYYAENGICIAHADCRDVLPQLEPVDLVLTDPPYGINYSSARGASWKNTEIAGDASTALRDWIVAEYASLPMAVFGTWKVSPPDNVRGCLVWDKGPAFGMGDRAFPWKGSWELIWMFGHGWQGIRDEGVLRGHIVPSWETHGRSHPHQKPVSLWKALLLKAPAGVVLDPFMGTGATLLAARDFNRKAIGIDIEERYCEIAARRLSQQVFEFKE